MAAFTPQGPRRLDADSRVLVVKLSSLGDLFHALPAVHRIKAGSGATIDWVTQPEYVDLVDCFADIDRVIPFPRRRAIRGFPAFRRRLREQAYDCVIDLQGLFKSGWVSRLARSQRRLGPSDHREGSRIFYTEVAGPPRPDRHAVDRALDSASSLGYGADAGIPAFSWPPVELPPGSPRIGFVPCSRWPTKNWDPDRFGELGTRLQEVTSGRIFLVGGPGDKEACSRIAASIPDCVNSCGMHSLPETGALLSRMDVVVSVDTGPMHMAAAMGIPVVAIFGPTDPGRTGPYGGIHRVVRAGGLDCMPCLARTCARGDLACQDRVDVDRVLSAVREVLAGGHPLHREVAESPEFRQRGTPPQA